MFLNLKLTFEVYSVSPVEIQRDNKGASFIGLGKFPRIVVLTGVTWMNKLKVIEVTVVHSFTPQWKRVSTKKDILEIITHGLINCGL